MLWTLQIEQSDGIVKIEGDSIIKATVEGFSCVSVVLVSHSLTRKLRVPLPDFPAVVVFCVAKLLGFNGNGTVGREKENRHASRRSRNII